MSLTFEPIAGACGAMASGLDLTLPISATDLKVIEAALCSHLMIVFRGQRLSPGELATFTRQLGPPSPVPFIQPVSEHKDVIAIVRRVDENPPFDFDGSWHSDFSFLREPPSFTVLHATESPPFGGDTIWANQYLALELLSPKMQGVLEPLDGVHSAANAFSPRLQASFDSYAEVDVQTSNAAFRTEQHPLVCRHPVTGRRCLYFNAEYTVGLAGLQTEEAKPLMEFLRHHSVRHEVTCRWRWSRGDVAIWDNRCLQHMAMPDYRGYERRMLRTTVRGSVPQR